MKLTTNFSKMEFDSRDGTLMPNEILNNVLELAQNLQKVRQVLGEPIHINSGYRSPLHNAAIGGLADSQHLSGKAADFSMKNYTSKDLVVIFEQMINEGQLKEGGLGLYNGFVHYDIRGVRSRWNLSTKYKDFW